MLSLPSFVPNTLKHTYLLIGTLSLSLMTNFSAFLVGTSSKRRQSSVCIAYSLTLIIFPLLFTLCVPPLPTAFAATITLEWDPASGDVKGYKVYYGTSSNDYEYNEDVGNFTSCTISSLTEGETYYFSATAYDSENIEGSFAKEISHTISVGELGAESSTAAYVTSPTPGSTLSGSSVNFKWTSGYNPYWLYIGTSAESKNIYNSGNLYSVTSLDVNNLPTDGSKIYVTLWYWDGNWQSEVFTYSAK